MFKTISRAMSAVAVAAVLFFGVGTAVAGAQSASECDISDGLDAYLECVAGGGGGSGGGGNGTEDGGTAGEAAESGAVAVRVTDARTLARTGSDVGSMVGIGSALVLLGGATVYGVRQRRQSTHS